MKRNFEALGEYLKPWLRAKQYKQVVEFFENQRIFSFLRFIPKNHIIGVLKEAHLEEYNSFSPIDLLEVLERTDSKIQETEEFYEIIYMMIPKVEIEPLGVFMMEEEYKALMNSIKSDGIRLLVELSTIPNVKIVKWETDPLE